MQVILTSVIVGGEWSLSHPGRLIPGEKALRTHRTGGWLGPRAGLEDMEKEKYFTPLRLELRFFSRPARSQSLHKYTICTPYQTLLQ
jgi:hypothetical protein